MVKTPICSFCAKTGTLCSQCKKKLRRKKVTSLDIDVSKYLIEMESTFSPVKDIDFQRAIPIKNYLALLVDEDSIPKFTAEVKTELSRRLKMEVIPIVQESTPRKSISNLFSDFVIEGIDRIFIPDGTQELQVRLKGNVQTLTIPLDVMREIAKYLTKTDIRIILDEKQEVAE